MNRILKILIILFCIFSANSVFADEHAKTRFWIPGTGCAFDVDLSDFSSEDSDIIHDDIGWQFIGDYSGSQGDLAINMKSAMLGNSSINFRDAAINFFKSQSAPFEDFKTREEKGFAILSCVMVYENGKDKYRQPHSFAFLAKHSTLLVLDFSSLDQKPVDGNFVDKVLGSITIIDEYQPTIFEYLAIGSLCYVRHDYVTAITFYEKVLESEKQKRALPKSEWLVLVDNLGMAYAKSDDSVNTRNTYEYGLSLEPHYPMFHYNLACYFAEATQIDSALVHLEEAFKYKSNMLPDEEMPDPLTDSSFINYWHDRRLKGLVSSFQKK